MKKPLLTKAALVRTNENANVCWPWLVGLALAGSCCLLCLVREPALLKLSGQADLLRLTLRTCNRVIKQGNSSYNRHLVRQLAKVINSKENGFYNV